MKYNIFFPDFVPTTILLLIIVGSIKLAPKLKLAIVASLNLEL